MLNRSQAPEYKTIGQINIEKARQEKLRNGIPVNLINAGSQEVVKMELIFPAGMKNQPASLISTGTNDMLDEGTKNFSAVALAEAFDFYGAFIETEATQDFASVSLYCLNKHLKKTIPLLAEMVQAPTFPEQEFINWITNKRQKFLVEEGKVATVCRKKFNAALFGENHPYGSFASIEDFEKVSTSHLKEFYSKWYTSEKCTMVVSGKIPKELTGLLDEYFGGDNWKGNNEVDLQVPLPDGTKGIAEVIEKNDAIQSAIRIGRLLFTKTHPDYFGMVVLNTVLGGYFGSRLMANIREDKGYTYGIGSGMVSLQEAGYFFITTEVGVDVCSSAIDEIYKEIDVLRIHLIPDEELELVKNYILGTFLRSVDGPFALADKYKGLLGYGLDYSYYDKFIESVKKVTPSELRDLANKYLQQEDLSELVVGKK